MAEVYKNFDPGLRGMLGGVPITGIYFLAPVMATGGVGGPTNGIWLAGCECEYVPELRGPWLNSSYAWRWHLLGFRPQIDLRFALLKDDDTGQNNGLSVLRNLWSIGMRQPEGYTLEINLFANNGGSAWRAVTMESSFAPKKIAGRATTGWELELKMKTTALVQPGDIGHWHQSLW